MSLQPRRRIGVAISDYVLDISVVAPTFFTGEVFSNCIQVCVCVCGGGGGGGGMCVVCVCTCVYVCMCVCV